MFEFERLEVYRKAKCFNRKAKELVERPLMKSWYRDQLRRAAVSIVLNIAEGSGRKTRAARNNFYSMARTSAYECAAIIDLL